jgi:hypothetical protein
MHERAPQIPRLRQPFLLSEFNPLRLSTHDVILYLHTMDDSAAQEDSFSIENGQALLSTAHGCGSSHVTVFLSTRVVGRKDKSAPTLQ